MSGWIAGPVTTPLTFQIAGGLLSVALDVCNRGENKCLILFLKYRISMLLQ